jgi:AraC-like DNA-binding protein
MCVINPGEVHTGQAKTNDGFDYQAIYPSTELMRKIVADVRDGATDLPWFDAAVITDPLVVARFSRLHDALDGASSVLERETYLWSALSALVSRYSVPRQPSVPDQHHPLAASRMREYLETHYSENITLDDLARVTGLSPWHAARVFRQAYDLPPHAYLDGVRVRRARDLVRQGHALAEIALATGFADQSHFTRRFKRHLGVTPGHYAQHHKNVQDGVKIS